MTNTLVVGGERLEENCLAGMNHSGPGCWFRPRRRVRHQSRSLARGRTGVRDLRFACFATQVLTMQSNSSASIAIPAHRCVDDHHRRKRLVNPFAQVTNGTGHNLRCCLCWCVVGARSEDNRESRRLVVGIERWQTRARSLAVDNKRLVEELTACKVRVVDLKGRLDAATENSVASGRPSPWTLPW